MRRIHRNWLPKGALDDAALGWLLKDVVRQWSVAWFVRPVMQPIDVGPPSVAATAMRDDGYWMKAGQGLAIAVPAAAHTKLVARMLDVSIPEQLNEADRRIVKKLARACLDDLGHRLAAAFRLPSEIPWVIVDHADMPDITTPHELDLGVEPQTPLLRIVAGEDLVIDMRKAGIRPASVGDNLPPIAAGLALQPVVVSASLGRCSLTVAEMAGLAEGDVLVFDRVIDKPLALTLDGKAILPGKCMVDHADDSLRLKILEPINR